MSCFVNKQRDFQFTLSKGSKEMEHFPIEEAETSKQIINN